MFMLNNVENILPNVINKSVYIQIEKKVVKKSAVFIFNNVLTIIRGYFFKNTN